MKKRLLGATFEILSIFIGITLSFFFEEYRQDKKDAQDRKEIVQALLTDILIYDQEMHYAIDFTQRSINRIDTALLLSSKDIELNKTQIENLIYVIGNDHSYAPSTSPAYIGLLSSDIWQQIPDSLRRDVFNLYEGNYGTLKVVYEKFTEYASFMKTHFFISLPINLYNQSNGTWRLESRDGEDSFKNVNKYLKKPEFRSALILMRNHYNKSIRYQKEAIESGTHIVTKLKLFLQSE